MKVIKESLVLLCIGLSLFFTNCSEMDDNYKQYLTEYSYSGKVTNTRTYVGYERVILAWDNPKDQKSKTILIEYDIDKKEKKFESLVDSVIIDELYSGGGYEFAIYTQDAAGNKSVPVTITALPVSKKMVERLEAPNCLSTLKDNIPAIQWNNLSTMSMHFNGQMSYTITGPDGFNLKGEFDLEIDRKDTPTTSYVLAIPELQSGMTYTIEYTCSVWPIAGKIVTYDLVQLTSSATIKMK